jgi:ABC-2 type transport system ATP-binding protein
MDALKVNNLTKHFGNFTAVDRVSFDVGCGEFFGFLGPNGAGKTTTIRMLTGLTAPSEGTASIMGCDVVRDAYRAKEHIGIVPDVSNVYDELTPRQNLLFSGELYGVSRPERTRQADRLIEMFGLADFRDKKVKGFSKGMKRKLTIAMALIHSPDVLFLDEPTSGLDVPGARTLKETLLQLNEDGTTVFLTTHILDEANTMCDRIGIIVKGKLVAIDSPEKLKRAIHMSQSVEISLDSMAGRVTTDLISLPGVIGHQKSGDKVRLFTPDPSSVVEAAFDYARGHGCRIVSVATLGPTFEDAFLAIVNGNGHGPEA